MAERLAELADRYELTGGAVDRLGLLVAFIGGTPDAPTTVRDPQGVLDVHIADSLAALDLADVRGASRIADLGSGAGFPALPLALALPSARLALVESAQRKAAFIERAVRAASVENAAIVWARAEDWAKEHQQGHDVVTVRAVAPLAVLVEYAAPLLRLSGVLVAWKGEVASEETARGGRAAAVVGMQPSAPRSVVPYRGSRRRTLHVFRKVEPTPVRFPRRAGMAVKRPLGG